MSKASLLVLCHGEKTKAQPTIIDVVNYPWVKFPTLIQEHHNDSLMLLYVNILRAVRNGTSYAIHRYIAAKLQIKNETTKKKGEKLAFCSLAIYLYFQSIFANQRGRGAGTLVRDIKSLCQDKSDRQRQPVFAMPYYVAWTSNRCLGMRRTMPLCAPFIIRNYSELNLRFCLIRSGSDDCFLSADVRQTNPFEGTHL